MEVQTFQKSDESEIRPVSSRHSSVVALTDDDNIKDGTEDANHNGWIDGENWDGKLFELDYWSPRLFSVIPNRAWKGS